MFFCRLLWKLLSPSTSSVSRCADVFTLKSTNAVCFTMMMAAWVKMDVLPFTTHPETKQKTLYGEPSPSQVDAYRTLNEAIIRYLLEECGVVVKDVNYDRVRRLEYPLFRAATYRERFYGMVADLKKELAAVEAERARLTSSDSRYATLFAAGRMVIASFADILPLGTLVVDRLAGASDISSVMYTGSRPPGTRVEQPSAFLENFMNRGPSITGSVFPPVRQERLLFFPMVSWT
jgi:hypothetical protein